MKKRGFLNLFMVAVLAISAGSLYSCKDYDDELRADLEGQIDQTVSENTSLKQLVDIQIGRIDGLVKDLNDAKKECAEERDKIQKMFDDYVTKAALKDSLSHYVTKDEFNKKVQEYAGIIAGFNTSIGNLEKRVAALEAAKKDAESRLDALETQVGENTNLLLKQQNNITELYTLVNNLQQEFNTTVKTINTTITNLTDKVTILGENLEGFGEDLSKLKQDLLDTQTNIESIKEELNTKITNLKEEIKSEIIDPAIDKVNNDIQDVKTQSENNKNQIENLNNIYKALEASQKITNESFKSRMDSLCKVTQALEDKMVSTDSVIQAKAERAKEYTDSLVKDAADKATAQMLEMSGALNELGLKFENHEGRIVALENMDEELKDSLESLGLKIDATGTLVDNLNTKVNLLDRKLVNALTRLDNLEPKVNDALSRINILEKNLAQAKADFKLVTDKLRTDLDKLREEFNPLKTEVSKQAAELARLNSVFENVLNQMITSVALNGAYSPVIGYFSLPTGLKSNVLAAFYGEALDDVNFPTALTNDYVYTDQAFTSREKELLGFTEELAYVGGQPIVEEGNNAGKLYVTVNPNSVDMSNKVWGLYNSIGEASPVKLGKAVRSNDKLTFGYTRSVGPIQTGFYEIPASLDANKIQSAKLRLEYNDLKEAIKDVLSTDDGVDLTNLFSTLYSAVNDIADANAVAVTWTDSLGEHSVLSDYGIAAVGVNPLSYAFMKDFHRDTFWGMDKAYSLLDKTVGKFKEITKKVTDQFPQFDIKQPRIDTITLQELSPELLGKFKVSQTLEDSIKVGLDLPSEKNAYYDAKQEKIIIPADTISAKDAAGNEIATVIVPGREYNVKDKEVVYNDKEKTFTVYDKYYLNYTFSVDMTDAVKELYDNFGEAIGDANAMVKEIKRFFDEDIQQLLDQVNGYGTKVEDILNEQIDNIKDKLTGYLDKINTKLCKLVNSVHSKVQPVMFVKANNDFLLLSSAKNYPSVLPSRFVLSLTSYTAELLTPASKKFVAVTDVIKGDESAKAGNQNLVDALKAANNGNVNLNKVLPGKTLGVEVKDLMPNHTYEFTYSAIDFNGMIVNTKYYVTVQ